MIATAHAVTYHYPSSEAPALADVNFDIEEGAFLLAAGPSGGGKSTLLRTFNGLVPQFYGGRFAGEVRVGGLPAATTAARRLAAVAGMVFQEPEAQSVADTVEDDIAFGLEQHGVAPVEMRRRIDRLLSALGIEHLQHRRIATLSGGERQRVAIASALALEPRLLLLDEPTSQLDGAGSESVLAAIEELHRRSGLAILVSEHRLDRILPIADCVIEVVNGRAGPMSPREAGARLDAVPPVCALGRLLGTETMPLTVDAARPLAAGRLHPRPARPASAPGTEAIRADGVTVAYGTNVALRGASISLREGEVVALMGDNGSGKTTLLRAIAGTVRPASGSISLAGRPASDSIQVRTATAGLVPQDPALALYRETVREEVQETLSARRADVDTASALAEWGISHLASRNPRDLSVGQQQRVALAAMLAHRPRAWLMDEPTRGMDQAAKAWLGHRLRDHARAGGCAIVATHDVESAATFATRVVGLAAGEVAFDLPAARAFAADGPHPTQVARIVPGATTLAEVTL